MIGPFDITLSGRSENNIFFIKKDGKKKGLKSSLSNKDLALELGIGSEDAKSFREEAWLQAERLPIWSDYGDEVAKFWKA